MTFILMDTKQLSESSIPRPRGNDQRVKTTNQRVHIAGSPTRVYMVTGLARVLRALLLKHIFRVSMHKHGVCTSSLLALHKLAVSISNLD